MNEIERAEARNLVARMRLANDPIFIIKKRRYMSNQLPPNYHGFENKHKEPTKYQLRILEYLSHGLSQEMTADAMGISVESIKTDLKAVRYKLKAKNTVHAVAIALRCGLIN